MRWFKHKVQSHRNPDLLALIEEWGWGWYGRWWALVEMVAEDVRPGNLTFTLQRNKDRPVSVKQLSRDLGTTVERLTNFCRWLADAGLIDAEAWMSRSVVFIPKLGELSDRYVHKLLSSVSRLSPQSSPIEEEVEEEVEEEGEEAEKREVPGLDVPAGMSTNIPQELLSKPGFQKAWHEWLSFLNEIHKPLRPSTAKRQLAFLSQQSDPVAVIEQSIQNGWQGLFPLKPQPGVRERRVRRKPVRDAIAVALEQMEKNQMTQLIKEVEGTSNDEACKRENPHETESN